MLIAVLLALQPVAPTSPALKNCDNGAVVRADDTCPLDIPSHRATERSIFFDRGEAEIRREWQAEITAAAEQSLRSGSRIALSAHSDRYGSAAANRRMSASRLQAVRAALIAAGVPPRLISGTAHGEERPLVPTADGVLEIHNRRVTLTVFP